MTSRKHSRMKRKIRKMTDMTMMMKCKKAGRDTSRPPDGGMLCQM